MEQSKIIDTLETYHVLGALMVVPRWPLRCPPAQLCSHAFWSVERGGRAPRPHAGHPGGSRGQAQGGLDGGGDKPSRAHWASGTSRGLGVGWLVRNDFCGANLQLLQHLFSNGAGQHFLVCSIGGNPRAALSPGCVGPPCGMYHSLHLSELALPSSMSCFMIITCLSGASSP